MPARAISIVPAVRGVTLFSAAPDKQSLPAGINIAREAFVIEQRPFEQFLRRHSRAQRGLVMMDREIEVEAWLP